MSWFKEDGLRYDEKGRILRLDQRVAPKLTPGDRFYDVAAIASGPLWALPCTLISER